MLKQVLSTKPAYIHTLALAIIRHQPTCWLAWGVGGTCRKALWQQSWPYAMLAMNMQRKLLLKKILSRPTKTW